VAVVCAKCGKATRIGFRILADNSKVRYCKRCDEVVENG
jgi:large subunit ribosomal protein L24